LAGTTEREIWAAEGDRRTV